MSDEDNDDSYNLVAVKSMNILKLGSEEYSPEKGRAIIVWLCYLHFSDK